MKHTRLKEPMNPPLTLPQGERDHYNSPALDGRGEGEGERGIFNGGAVSVKILKDFLIYLSVERGLSQNTVEAYSRDIGLFQKLLISKNKELDSFSKADILDFLNDVKDKGYSATSICRFISSIRGICRYMIIEKIIKEDPSEKSSDAQKVGKASKGSKP